MFFAQKKDKYGNGGLNWTKGNASEGVSVFLPGNKGEGEGGEGQSPKVSAMKERERERELMGGLREGKRANTIGQKGPQEERKTQVRL